MHANSSQYLNFWKSVPVAAYQYAGSAYELASSCFIYTLELKYTKLKHN